jgi:HAD superfamily hydrolase (TIGR01509 family)
MKNVKAIIFDCDGTLLDSERIYLSTWELVAKPMGYDVPMEVLMDNRGKGTEYCRQNLLRAMGPDFPLDEIYRIRKQKNEEVFYATENVVKDGVKELLAWMKKHNIAAAVASAKPCKMTSDHLEHAGILGEFQTVIGGDMVEHNKPEPDSFLLAAKLMGVLSEECIVIGDTPSDMKAAKAAGMRAVFVPDLVEADEEIKELADIIVTRMDNIISILEEDI